MTHKPWEHAKASGSEGDPLAARFVSSLHDDRRLYPHDIQGSLAHARMLQQVNLITRDDLDRIEQGLAEIQQEIDDQGDAWPGWKVELEDVHMCLEAALIEKVGDPGRKLHTGRSRNDQVATDLQLWITQAGAALETQRIPKLLHALVALAQRQGHLVMPSYTHLQRAQPIVVGAELLAWVEALDRCARRCAALVQVGAVNPLGSGAIAGSSLPLDRAQTAQALAIGLPSPNSLDATASRDQAIDFVYALAMISMTLSRWAEQWIIYATTEFNFITLDNLYTTGSSMMPQKQNPDMLELVRGKTGQAYGSLMALLTLCKGLPIGYSRDLQEDKHHLFAAYDAVCDCLDMAAAIISTTTFNQDPIQAGLGRGYLDATSLAEYLVTRGVPFRTSHQVVGRLVHQCQSENRESLADLPLQAMQQACDAIAPEVYDWLGAENVVKRYQSAGNAGQSGFQAQLHTWTQRLKER